jgi:hypothetical protein
MDAGGQATGEQRPSTTTSAPLTSLPLPPSLPQRCASLPPIHPPPLNPHNLIHPPAPDQPQFLLSKFWGLMNERDRPWHFEAVVHLCCKLPKPARLFYRRLKPSTLQRILARRAQASMATMLLACLCFDACVMPGFCLNAPLKPPACLLTNLSPVEQVEQVLCESLPALKSEIRSANSWEYKVRDEASTEGAREGAGGASRETG